MNRTLAILWPALLLSLPGWAADPAVPAEAPPAPAGAVTEVEVNIRSGSLKVEGTDAANVSFEAENGPAPGVERDGARMFIGGREGAGRSQADGDFRLRLPRGVALRVNSISADLSISGLTARVRLESVSGDVRLTDCRANVDAKTVSGDLVLSRIGGEVVAKTVSGDVSGTELAGEVLELKTVSGDAKLDGVAARRVRLSSHSGDVFLRAAPPAGAEMNLRSFSGDVRVVLPEAAALELDASSRSGDVEADGEWVVDERGDNRLRGRRHGGGSELTVSTFSGDVQISLSK